MKKLHLLLLSLLSGLLFTAAWPVNGFPFLLFVAFVPLLFVEQAISDKNYKYSFIRLLPYPYIAFLIWNILTTYWVYYSTVPGSIAAFTINALLMALAFCIFHVTKRRLGAVPGYLSLVVYWFSYEYLHLQWDLSWPWLCLGNGFSEYYKWIQWYEYTGTFGGAAWIFLLNVMIYQLLRKVLVLGEKWLSQLRAIITILLVLVVPITISLFIYNGYEEEENPVEVVVVQPNIDPYNEKFSNMSPADQLEKFISLAEEKITPNTTFLVGPETALPRGLWETQEEDAPSIKRLRKFLEAHPNVSIVTGLTSYKMYLEGEKVSATARQYRNKNMYYDVYNTAMIMTKDRPVQFYHKSKLVPGVEKMPYPSIFGSLQELAIDLGGMSGSHGMQKHRGVFFTPDSIGAGPAICYESIYGEYMTEYIQRGADFIFIITNDGWWRDSPGYRQHNSYARMRAIENRRSIARSANTGISCFINQRGDISQATSWWVPIAIRGEINANDKWTFYTKYGDYIARVALLLAGLLALWTISVAFNKSKRRLG